MSKPLQRPLRLTLFVWALEGLSAWNALRVLEAVLFWRALVEYGARPGPLYLAIVGSVWLAVAGAIAYGLIGGRSWSWPAACAFPLAYGLWYWIDRLLSQTQRPGGPLALAITLIALALSCFSLLSRPTRRFLQAERHDRKPETPTTP